MAAISTVELVVCPFHSGGCPGTASCAPAIAIAEIEQREKPRCPIIEIISCLKVIASTSQFMFGQQQDETQDEKTKDEVRSDVLDGLQLD